MSKKTLGYRLFGLFFTFFRLFPLKENKAFLIATHDDGPEGNIAVMAQTLKKKRPGMKLVYLTKKDRGQNPFSFFCVKAYHMATSSIILLDNVFMPMAYTPISKKATVIQLWHGTGTIKRFGMDSDGPEVARISKKGNKRLTWLTVNGERTRRQYATAFGLPPEKIRTTGLPRTDLLMDEAYMQKKKKDFFREIRKIVKDPEKHRYVLYAPTFRDEETDDPQLMLDVKRVIESLPEDVILLLRFHPFVAECFASQGALKRDLTREERARVLDMSLYPGVTTLLSVADVLVTDYSSIVFEYALCKRPMIFYAYDLEEFAKNGRDFYEPYESFVPGPVVRDEETLIHELREALSNGEGTVKQTENRDRIETFLQENYRRRDGRAAERVAMLAFREKTSRQSGSNLV
ncbi:MAG: CDP-glycerol glycerophosphotransferase family protein [Eubacterium sp.]|nr:CDP-glycerol glycerophosphotransferase family protein [Eubacterium sp.]